MECAQINVSGGSGSASPATVSLPGAYKVRYYQQLVVAASNRTQANDPGILLSIYYPPLTSYTIPGPV
jgi:hypothetical protein